jgi:hypothetical protein
MSEASITGRAWVLEQEIKRLRAALAHAESDRDEAVHDRDSAEREAHRLRSEAETRRASDELASRPGPVQWRILVTPSQGDSWETATADHDAAARSYAHAETLVGPGPNRVRLQRLAWETVETREVEGSSPSPAPLASGDRKPR